MTRNSPSVIEETTAGCTQKTADNPATAPLSLCDLRAGCLAPARDEAALSEVPLDGAIYRGIASEVPSNAVLVPESSLPLNE